MGLMESSASITAVARRGDQIFVLGIVTVGSSVFVGRFTRVGSTLSASFSSRFGASVSEVSPVHLDSSMSLRALQRFGSGVSITRNGHVSGELSVLDGVSMSGVPPNRSASWLGSLASVSSSCLMSGGISPTVRPIASAFSARTFDGLVPVCRFLVRRTSDPA